MPLTDISTLPDDARIWIFGISPSLDSAGEATVFATVDPFLRDWAAHGTPILAGRALIDGSFLVIAVDQRSDTSGCSIDRMFGSMRELERKLSVSILDSGRLFTRDADGAVAAMSRSEFRERGSVQTRVFDTNAERLGLLRDHSWEKTASDSWHKALLA